MPHEHGIFKTYKETSGVSKEKCFKMWWLTERREEILALLIDIF